MGRLGADPANLPVVAVAALGPLSTAGALAAIRRRVEALARPVVALERSTRPTTQASRVALGRRWAALPDHVRTDAQTLGRVAVGCEGTHGVFPRCDFTCTPCYHSADANRVRVDGRHTLHQVEAQMAFLASVRGPHAHAQLIGGEVTLLDPDDHAEALQIMVDHGREPMSFTHGDIDYAYLERLACGPDGRRRFRRLSFAGHFDSTMRGRRGLARTEDEADLDPYRRAFCDAFARLGREHGVRSFLAHNMTVVPANVAQIPAVVAACRSMGFRMLSFQPAARVGRRQARELSALGADDVWAAIERGAGTTLPFRAVQTGDERCNRSAFGFYVGDRWLPLLDETDPDDLAARDAFYRWFGGIRWTTPPGQLALQLARVLCRRPALVPAGLRWAGRRARAAGAPALVRALAHGQVRSMTFVMHRFMDADDVRPAWDLLQRGERSRDPRILETQERLEACFYGMAHPETGQVVPACVQHAVLDPAENRALVELLPLPRRRGPTSEECDPQTVPSSTSVTRRR